MTTKKFALPLGARIGLGFASVLMVFGVAMVTAISLSPSRQQQTVLAAAMVAAMIVGALLAWRCVRALTRSIRAIVDQAWRLVGGDLAVFVVRDRRDELGELQQALACLEEQLRHIERLRRLMLQVRDSCDVLAGGPNPFTAANAACLVPTPSNAPPVPAGRDRRPQQRSSTTITWGELT
jgi:methyl-accepting chemotaxis protein